MDVKLPNGRVIRGVPEGTPKDIIMQKAIAAGLATERDFGIQQQESQQGFNNLDVPTDANLESQSIAGAQPEPTLIEKAKGAGEALLTLATGATGGTAGYLGGSLVGATGELTGLTDDGQKIAEEYAGALTFQPRTEYGKELVSDIGNLLGALPPVMGGAPVQSARMASIPTAKALSAIGKTKRAGQRVIQSASKTKRALAEEIRAGNRNAGNIAMQLDADGTLIKNPNVKKAVQLMGNDDAAYSTAINFEKMNPATKSQINKMLDVIESNKISGDPSQVMSNRPVNVIGDSLAKRVNKLNEIKNSASKQIGELIKGDLGDKPANVNKARNDFISALREADVDVGVNENGRLVADTSRTLTNVDEVVKIDKLNNVLSRLQKGNIPAKEAHRLKRNLREMVSYDPAAPGATKVSSEIENAFKKLSTDLGESVSAIDNRYKIANQKMADSLGVLQDVDRQLGRQIMIGDDLATSKLGSLSKRIGTNLASREQVISMVDEIDNALSKRGIRPKDDIKRQVAALADLEKIFKVEGEQSPFGFQARIAQGVADVATGGQASATTQLLDAAVNRFRTMNQLEFNDKMKALRALSKVDK
jgi:hypothetical protein